MILVHTSHLDLYFYKNILLLQKSKRDLVFNKLRRRLLSFFFKIRWRSSSTFFYLSFLTTNYSCSIATEFFFIKPLLTLFTYPTPLISRLKTTILSFMFMANTLLFYFFKIGKYFYFNLKSFINVNIHLPSVFSLFSLYNDSVGIYSYFGDLWFRGMNSRSPTTYTKRARLFNLQLKPFFIYFNYLITKYISFLANAPVVLCVLTKPTLLLSLGDIIFLLYFFKICKISQFSLRSVFKPHDFFGLVFFAFRWFDFTWLLRRLQVILDSITIFRHRFFWNFFFSLLRRYIYTYFRGWRLTGIYISLRGKIGVVGNSRKRRLLWQIGKSSPSQFKKTIYYTQDFFYTSTGAIGFRVWILH